MYNVAQNEGKDNVKQGGKSGQVGAGTNLVVDRFHLPVFLA